MTEMPKEKKKKSNNDDLAFKAEFKYSSSKNPYNDRLQVFDQFVLQDEQGESHQGKWSQEVFNNELPLEVEIGSGYGHFMIEHTQKDTGHNFIGLDHRFKRSFHLAKKLAKLEHKNFRYLRARGERLSFLFGESELTNVYYFFPDPWPKARHHKKRLFQKKFLDELYKVLKPGGLMFIKTDHDGYFEWMLDELKGEKRFSLEIKTFDLREEFPSHFLASFQTKFEKIFLEKQIKIKAMVLKSLKK
ncbi:MAG: tRNA (guanosine(46)-N7)-methyltransferase TrmB [Halobacteriovoraceae bacterium]|jgi:tRNA (guanine-N7-)-methyltransferase|nr:tRNA (guanosine(46)-N7)-methyltransferase TrmB [Halobacteriovoraceae bacterium]